MVIFNKLEKDAKKKLISLYEDFIRNPNDLSLESRSLECDQEFGGVSVFSEIVSYAGNKASLIALKEISKEEAINILKKLKE
jgi:hypothetical protein